jgi:hypothetical protein
MSREIWTSLPTKSSPLRFGFAAALEDKEELISRKQGLTGDEDLLNSECLLDDEGFTADEGLSVDEGLTRDDVVLVTDFVVKGALNPSKASANTTVPEVAVT